MKSISHQFCDFRVGFARQFHLVVTASRVVLLLLLLLICHPFYNRNVVERTTKEALTYSIIHLFDWRKELEVCTVRYVP